MDSIADPELLCPEHACAVCGARLNSNLQLGSRDPWALAVRRAKISAHRHPTERTKDFDITWIDEEFENYFNKETRPATISARKKPSWDPEVEKESYDPEICHPDNSKWLSKVQCIYKEHGKDAVLSGPVQLTRWWSANVSIHNPTHTGPRNHYALYETDTYVHQGDGVEVLGDEPICFPVHTVCVPVLSRLLSEQDDLDNIDLSTVYQAMIHLVQSRDLALDYGELNSAPDCGFMGEEYVVSEPILDSSIETVIRDKLHSASMKGNSQLVSEYKGRINAFTRISPDVMACIVDELDAQSLLNLSTASWPACDLLGYNTKYWRTRIDKDMPWTKSFLPQLVANAEQTQELSFKKLYGWLELRTRPDLGVTHPWLGLTNLRRIWRAGEKLADFYKRLKAGESLDAIQADYASTAASDDEGCEIESDTDLDDSDADAEEDEEDGSEDE